MIHRKPFREDFEQHSYNSVSNHSSCEATRRHRSRHIVSVTYRDNCVVNSSFIMNVTFLYYGLLTPGDSSETLSETVSNSIVKIEYITTVYARHCHCHLLG